MQNTGLFGTGKKYAIAKYIYSTAVAKRSKTELCYYSVTIHPIV